MKKPIKIKLIAVKIQKNWNGVRPFTRIEREVKAYRRKEKFGNKWD